MTFHKDDKFYLLDLQLINSAKFMVLKFIVLQKCSDEKEKTANN